MSKGIGRLLMLAITCCSLLLAALYTQHSQLMLPGERYYVFAKQKQELTEVQSEQGDILYLQNVDKKPLQGASESSIGTSRASRATIEGTAISRTSEAVAEGIRSATATDKGDEAPAISQEGPIITVRLSKTNELEHVPIEQYVLGVALAELPGSFEQEAIKAQMLAIRTYIAHRLANAPETEEGLANFEITDTTADQVYMPLHEVEQYAIAYPEYYVKFVEALVETEQLIISYEDKPIDAVFFSTSNGFTQDAEHLWGKPVDYLQKVASPWDELYSPSYETQVQLTFTELYERLNLKQARRNGKLSITKVVRNDSGRIKSLQVNGASFTGKELREQLGLSSTAMTWSIDSKEQSISIICYGYGHGIGLSQWGAHGMAMEGYEAEAIVKHYYTGVELQKFSLNF